MVERIQLSRRKGWRMPPNTVKVDRSTPWGNPHVVHERGPNGETAAEYAVLGGFIMISCPASRVDEQRAYVAYVKKNIKKLRGKNLACWCKPGAPCHADVLLEIANGKRR